MMAQLGSAACQQQEEPPHFCVAICSHRLIKKVLQCLQAQQVDLPDGVDANELDNAPFASLAELSAVATSSNTVDMWAVTKVYDVEHLQEKGQVGGLLADRPTTGVDF